MSTKKGLVPKKQAPKSEVEKSDKRIIQGMDVEEIKKSIAEDVMKQADISEEESQTFMELLEEATMPVAMTDEEFKLGPSELDIRGLSNRNTNQMIFRTLVLQNVYLKQLLTASLDQIRLLMVIADKMGVENISKATDQVVLKEKKLNKIGEKKESDEDKESNEELKESKA